MSFDGEPPEFSTLSSDLTRDSAQIAYRRGGHDPFRRHFDTNLARKARENSTQRAGSCYFQLIHMRGITIVGTDVGLSSPYILSTGWCKRE